ncbi:protein peste [Scaptodrosophila lebanonensis]|uniref:Protein peste n=1 Tax=Drosophila lebanonensis TaxID=7225 RepID=A0A6J2U505_DROLE|nr:protein peste [Scaptodrosophila lebanonensis]
MIAKQRIILTSLVGLFLATFGIVYVFNLERIQRFTLKWLMVLRPGSMITNLWENPSLDITVDIYLFNWTNAADFKNNSIKPHFEELGPYTFTEKMQKQNIVWHDENSTVSYFRKSSFYFDEAASVGNLTDPVVAPNSLAAGVYNKIQNWSPMVRSALDLGLKIYGNDITIVRPANDWLFNGFDTPLIKMSKLLPSSIIPELQFPYERMGYGYPRNGSTEVYGHHNVYTGRDEFSKLGQIARWRYDTVAGGHTKCGHIKGSTGEFHTIPLKQGEPISYFLPDLCRELYVDYAGTTVYEGIHAYVYKGTARNLANGTDNPDNSCYCSDDCQEVPSGLLNISACWYNAPVFFSYPHYYQADPYYVNQVDGLKPDKDRHEMTLILEPKTGMLLDIRARVMISLLVEPWKHSTMYRKSRRTFFPLVWADYNPHITPELLGYLKLLSLSEVLGKVCGLICVAIGVIMLLWYPRQIYWQKQLMRRIELSNLENRAQTAARSDQFKAHAEASPLLVGLQYMASSKEGNSTAS